ncbi:MAG: hypothetical protein U0871_22180 [Gemmataceae bacterium]
MIRYGSSLYLPPISFVDVFTDYQDNFLPIAREPAPGAVRPNWTQLTGLHFRLNLYTPYWNPERGVWVDLVAAGGAAGLENTVGMAQLKGEFAAARRLPDEWGPYLSRLTVAGRVALQGAWPGRGQFFTLGGSTLFRGFDLKERQGSFLWATNAEVRVPVCRDVRWNTLDSVFGVRNVYVAGFYDAGAIYNSGNVVGGTAHARDRGPGGPGRLQFHGAGDPCGWMWPRRSTRPPRSSFGSASSSRSDDHTPGVGVAELQSGRAGGVSPLLEPPRQASNRGLTPPLARISAEPVGAD